MSSKAEVELKGGMYTFMSLKLHTSSLDVIDRALADKVQQAPGFFKDTPVVVDLSPLEALEAPVTDGHPQSTSHDADSDTAVLTAPTHTQLDVGELLACIRGHKLIPIVASVSNKASRLATSIDLPLIEASVRRTQTARGESVDQGASESRKASGPPSLLTGATGASDPAASTGKSPQTPGQASHALDTKPDVDLSLTAQEVQYVVKSPVLVNRPVRSGQQMYARDTDLIVMGQVGAGAEVVADNNIHVYGPLRGKALCGVSGNTKTRIFCQSLEAELVSVAGNYRLLEHIPPELIRKPAQIWLDDDDKLRIEPL